MLVVAS